MLKNLSNNKMIVVLLLLATLALYHRVWTHDYSGFDDSDYITDNPVVKRGLTADGVRWAFTTTTAANWHPLTWLSHMLDVTLFGLNPAGHHIVNVLFHACNAVLLFLVLGRMTGGVWQSAFVAALFALHPLHVESVAWVAERKDVLSTLFWMLTLGAYFRYVKYPGTTRYLAVAGLFLLGLMSKPMLVTLPFVLLLLDYWPLRRLAPVSPDSAAPPPPFPPMPMARLILEKAPLFLLTAGSCAITYYAQAKGGATGPLKVYPLGVRFANAVVAYAGYIRKMVWPSSLAVYYPHAGSSLPAGKIAAAGVMLVGVTSLVIREAKRRPYLSVGWFWYLGTLVPVIGLIQVGAQAMADRYTYVPLIGLFLAAAWGIPDLFPEGSSRKPLLSLLAGTAIVPLAVVAYVQTSYWRDGETLFRRAYELAPDHPLIAGNYGAALAEKGKIEQAVVIFQNALKMDPGNELVHNNLGGALAKQEKIEEAIFHFMEAIRINPRFAQAHSNLGHVLSRTGKTKDAIQQYREALAIMPDDPATHFNLATALEMEGNLEDAAEHYRNIPPLNPRDVKARVRLGMILAGGGKTEEAIAHYLDALSFDPDDTSAHYNLGVALDRQGRTEDAVVHYRAVLRKEPGNAKAHVNLGLALTQKGEMEEGILHLREALRINPNNAKALNNLGVALVQAGNLDEAAACFREVVRIDPADKAGQANLERARKMIRKTR